MDESPTLVIEAKDVTLLRKLRAPSRPCLLLYSGADAGQRFDLEPGSHVIGRVAEAQVRVEGSGISRQHARLEVEGSRVTLQDLGSANGTLVNEESIDGPTVLQDGDLVRVGNVVLRFHSRNNLDLLLHDKIYEQATVDAGTGAFNRKFLLDTLRQSFPKARAAGRPLSVICYDLDHFKKVNDTYGHAAGDTVLRITTTIARAELRGSDRLARVGGEEFTILLENTPATGALELAERLRKSIAGFPIELPNPDLGRSSRPVEHYQTISLGVAELSADMINEQALLEAGDRALYAAKRKGRNQVCV
jgi:two-component system, cell cycle response regulator